MELSFLAFAVYKYSYFLVNQVGFQRKASHVKSSFKLLKVFLRVPLVFRPAQNQNSEFLCDLAAGSVFENSSEIFRILWANKSTFTFTFTGKVIPSGC